MTEFLEHGEITFCVNDINSIESIKINDKIHTLIFRGCILTEKIIFCLVKLVKINRNIKKISICFCKISHDISITLSDFIKKNNTLKKISMILNDIIVDDMNIILNAIVTNNVLEHIHIRNIRLDNNSAKAIIKLIKNNNLLTSLALEDDSLNMSTKEIINAIEINNTITSLEIRYNKQEFNSFIQMIKNNYTLKSFRLISTSRIVHEFTSILEALKFNYTLNNISIYVNNVITYEQSIAMIDICERNLKIHNNIRYKIIILLGLKKFRKILINQDKFLIREIGKYILNEKDKLLHENKQLAEINLIKEE